MRLRQVAIKNFRILKEVTFPVSDRTVIVGENDAGKSAIVDAIRIALGRGPMGRLSPFDESDYHLDENVPSPEASPGIEVTLWFREDRIDEWPESVKMALAEIDRPHPITGLDTIGLRLTSKYEESAAEATTKWEFLDLDGQPLAGRAASPAMLTRFLNYVVFQHLPALRNPEHEFSIRSKTWGRILRQVSLTPDARAKIEEAVKALNDLLVSSDPLFARLVGLITKVGDVMPLQGADPFAIRAAPTEPWELMSRSELAVRGRGSPVQIPLLKHGLGLQSLAVLFLLEAYIELALRQEFFPETEALLAIEEPEAHLHPQAVLSFARYTESLKSQLILTTHSPYFLGTNPIDRIVFVRSRGPYSEVRHIVRSYSCTWPKSPGVIAMCKGRAPRWEYDEHHQILRLNGSMSEDELRNLEQLASGDGDALSHIREIYEQSQSFLSDEELRKLSEWAGRMRGHIFFARSWLLCEGPSDLILYQGLSRLMNKSIESVGASIIDCRMHGSVGPFVALAQNLGIPWLLACDSDEAGMEYVEQARRRGLAEPDLSNRIRHLQPEKTTIEMALARSRLLPTVLKAATSIGFELPDGAKPEEIESHVVDFIERQHHKVPFAQEFCRLLPDSGHTAADIPKYFVDVIDLAAQLAA